MCLQLRCLAILHTVTGVRSILCSDGFRGWWTVDLLKLKLGHITLHYDIVI